MKYILCFCCQNIRRRPLSIEPFGCGQSQNFDTFRLWINKIIRVAPYYTFVRTIFIAVGCKSKIPQALSTILMNIQLSTYLLITCPKRTFSCFTRLSKSMVHRHRFPFPTKIGNYKIFVNLRLNQSKSIIRTYNRCF